MALRSLGRVVVASAGTPVQITANEPVPADRVAAHSISVQAWHANTGRLYVGDRSTMNRVTGEGVLMVLAIPTANALAQFTATLVNAPVGFSATGIWLDVDVNGESGLVSILT